jgi:hypothetical protein
MGGNAQDPNLEAALLYLSWMEALLVNGVVQDFYPLGPAPANGDSDYIKGYKRLLDLLKDAGKFMDIYVYMFLYICLYTYI